MDRHNFPPPGGRKASKPAEYAAVEEYEAPQSGAYNFPPPQYGGHQLHPQRNGGTTSTPNEHIGDLRYLPEVPPRPQHREGYSFPLQQCLGHQSHQQPNVNAVPTRNEPIIGLPSLSEVPPQSQDRSYNSVPQLQDVSRRRPQLHSSAGTRRRTEQTGNSKPLPEAKPTGTAQEPRPRQRTTIPQDASGQRQPQGPLDGPEQQGQEPKTFLAKPNKSRKRKKKEDHDGAGASKGSKKKKPPRQHSAAATLDPRNLTIPMEGQRHWSYYHLPDILYQLYPDAPKSKQPQHLPQKPSPFPGGRPLRVFDILPDRISSNVEEFRVEAWLRYDRRIQLRDLLDRMHPSFRIQPNTLQQRGVRFRQLFMMLSWGAGNTKSDKYEKVILRKLAEKGLDPALNTTRGLTPGLINPSLGEEGGRVPVRPAAKKKYKLGTEPTISCPFPEGRPTHIAGLLSPVTAPHSAPDSHEHATDTRENGSVSKRLPNEVEDNEYPGLVEETDGVEQAARANDLIPVQETEGVELPEEAGDCPDLVEEVEEADPLWMVSGSDDMDGAGTPSTPEEVPLDMYELFDGIEAKEEESDPIDGYFMGEELPREEPASYLTPEDLYAIYGDADFGDFGYQAVLVPDEAPPAPRYLDEQVRNTDPLHGHTERQLNNYFSAWSQFRLNGDWHVDMEHSNNQGGLEVYNATSEGRPYQREHDIDVEYSHNARVGRDIDDGYCQLPAESPKKGR